MVIHVVKPGDSIYSIGKFYGVSPDKIIADNELEDPGRLVVGQTIVVIPRSARYSADQGETIDTIAEKYGTTPRGLEKMNPGLAGDVKEGQKLFLPRNPLRQRTIEVNGYAFPNINMDVLRKTLPYLTYLSIFSYEVRADGSLKPINDEPLIQAARAANVAPMMVITNLAETGGFSSDLARTILTNTQVRETLIRNIISTLQTKNYRGLDIDFEYIYPADRERYNEFLRIIIDRLRRLGFIVTTAVAPKIAADQPGLLYEAHDYPVHGALADHVILMTYEWGYTYGPPRAVAPLNEVRRVINYAVSAIPRRKILMGIPNYGYNWTLPFQTGDAATAVTNVGAVELAARENAAISYDPRAQAPYFTYYDDTNREHVVWFEDARSIQAKLRLVEEYNLGGVSYWTIGRYFPQNWLVLSSMFNIRKIL